MTQRDVLAQTTLNSMAAMAMVEHRFAAVLDEEGYVLEAIRYVMAEHDELSAAEKVAVIEEIFELHEFMKGEG